MKLLITGANGFIGKNLSAELQNIQYGRTKKYKFLADAEILYCDVETSLKELDRFCAECDFVFHLAGVNRPITTEEFMEGNFGFTTTLIGLLKKHNNKAPVLMSSSIQAALDNEYGKSKKAGEDYILKYGQDNGIQTYIYRLPNVFGKWCRPNYNSVVATFCHNIARDLEIKINDTNYKMTLVYVDDVVRNFISTVKGEAVKDGAYCKIDAEYNATLGEIATLLYSFKESRKNLMIPDMSDEFTKKLYATYLSYLPEDDFGYKLIKHSDTRGSFTEFIHTEKSGQVSINVSKPHITKGQHWHHTKNEKFLVVSGKGVIRFRRIDSDKVIEYFVTAENPEVIDIPVGYTHNIENLGENDMVTIMWCNEIFDINNPDTYFTEV